MPGFNIGGTGGLNGGPANTTETRRKHRWVFESMEPFDSPSLLLLKEATRPHPIFEEPEMHHNQEKAYFAGKYAWEPIKLVWYDAEQAPDISGEIYGWLNIVIDVPAATVDLPSAYKKQANLQMIAGDGTPTETWQLFGCWPQDVNWNTLDYADTEIQQIEVNMRIDRAVRN